MQDALNQAIEYRDNNAVDTILAFIKENLTVVTIYQSVVRFLVDS